MQVWLTFKRSGREDRRCEVALLRGHPVLLGRDPRCALVFHEDDRTVSAAHAKLWLDEDRLTITDVGSRYGTFVNGRAISKARLERGDRIQFGARGPEAIVDFNAPDDLPSGEVSLHENLPADAGPEVALTLFRDLPARPEGTSLTDYLLSLDGKALSFQPGESAEAGSGPAPGDEGFTDFPTDFIEAGAAAAPLTAARTPDASRPEDEWQGCPFCGEWIRKGGRSCPACLRSLSPGKTIPPGANVRVTLVAPPQPAPPPAASPPRPAAAQPRPPAPSSVSPPAAAPSPAPPAPDQTGMTLILAQMDELIAQRKKKMEGQH